MDSNFTSFFLDEATIYNYIGYAAALATFLTFTIQIVKIVESKNVTNLSSYMYIIYSLGLICWATYGVFLNNWLIVLANVITFLLTFTILVLILYYDAEDKIERARRDALTGVFNRKYFESALPAKLVDAKLNKKEASLLMISLPNYDNIAKKLGKKASDKLLKVAAKFLDSNLRGDDMVAYFEKNKFIAYLDGADAQSAKSVITRLSKGAAKTKANISKNIEQALDLEFAMVSTKEADDVEILFKKVDGDVQKTMSKPASVKKTSVKAKAKAKAKKTTKAKAKTKAHK